jgi:hypothetical protein
MFNKILDDIIEETRRACEHLENASEKANSVGDNPGAQEIEKVAREVEKVSEKFNRFKDKKNN